NEDMKKAHESTPVKGAEFAHDSFGKYKPEQKADVVHESMAFQFMSPDRASQFQEVADNYLKPNGIFIVEEKVGNSDWDANERKKDEEFKSKYYTPEQIAEKNKTVTVSDFDSNEGMAGNMVTEDIVLRELQKHFKHVRQYWDGGNFKGYVASNNRAKVDAFVKNMGSTQTEFSNRADDHLINITTGQRDPEEKSIRMTPGQALKQQVQTFYRGMDKGVRKGKKLADALIKRVQDGVKDHPVSKRQMSVLMTMIRNTNLYTPGSISKLARTIEKIADDADYAEKLSRASALQKLVRRRSKGKGQYQELASVAKAFSKLDPTIDPDNYSNVAGALLNSFKKPGSAGYAPVSLRSVNNFIERQTAAQNEELAKQLREEHGLSDDFSLDEIMAVIGDEDSAFETEDKAAKAREKLQQAAEYTMMALPEDSSDPDIKTLREAPLDEFSAQQLVQYIRTVDNIAVNNDRSGVEQVKVQIEAARNLKEMKALKATGKIGTISAQTYSLPMLFHKVWNNLKAAAEAYRLTGAGEIYNATSRVEGEEAAFYQAFADKLKAVKGSKDPDTQLLAGLYAELIRHPKGADPQAHFESSK